MKRVKIIFLILASVLLVSVLIIALSAGAKTPEGLIQRAEKVLTKKPYVIEMQIDYSASSIDVSGIFDQLGTNETTVFFKDGNFRAHTGMTINYGEGDNLFSSVYTAVDGTLYVNHKYTFANVKRDIKSKAEISSEQSADLVENLLIVGMPKIEDFSEVELTKVDGDRVIVCRGASEDKYVALEAALISQLEGTSERVKLTSVEMTVELDGKKYDTVTVSCLYEVVISGESYVVGMTVTLDYDYDEYVDIRVPDDAIEYDEVDIENLII